VGSNTNEHKAVERNRKQQKAESSRSIIKHYQAVERNRKQQKAAEASSSIIKQ
jgi:hypothetical protein